MKRVFLVLAVAALMAAMLVAMAMPAFADKPSERIQTCRERQLNPPFSLSPRAASFNCTDAPQIANPDTPHP